MSQETSKIVSKLSEVKIEDSFQLQTWCCGVDAQLDEFFAHFRVQFDLIRFGVSFQQEFRDDSSKIGKIDLIYNSYSAKTSVKVTKNWPFTVNIGYSEIFRKWSPPT